MTAERVAMIRERLEQAFEPDSLEVVDESHLHVGHPGARDGRGHFRVRIGSDRLTALTRLAQHRAVYDAMGGLMQSDIHALTIEVVAGGAG